MQLLDEVVEQTHPPLIAMGPGKLEGVGKGERKRRKVMLG